MSSTLFVHNHIKALIFDCDGTLIDSMPLHMEAWEHSIKSLKGEWDYDFFFSKKGKPDTEIVELYNLNYRSHLDAGQVAEIKDEYFYRHADRLRPVAAVVETAAHYRNILPMAVASGSSRKNVDFQLDTLGIKEYFSVILSADDRLKPKPSPDIFLEAAKRMKVSPRECQVFEDAELGIEAARNAGMYCTDVRLIG
ncbi:MAG TPA: HAD-IA family hydrolase [Bacteroidota bacterium]|nr:HAD-IA family hydrolase [Bacteroidota bacterium]